MQSVEFKVDILVMPLGGAYVLFGIQWLVTLGDIRWNFKQLKMEFQIGGKKVSLSGNQPGGTRVIDNQKMDKLLHRSVDLSMILVSHAQHMSPNSTVLQLQQVKAPDDLQNLLNQYSTLFETLPLYLLIELKTT